MQPILPPDEPTPDREAQTAVAPLNTIDPDDVAAASGKFDQWLRSISGDYVTLERLTMVAGSIPVLGNVMAAIDVLLDLVTVVQKYLKKQSADFLDWVSLGINLIGIIPLPPTMGAARMTLRPTLHLVKQQARSGVQNLSESLVAVLVTHLNDKLAGEIDTFAQTAMSKLGGILQDAAALADQMADALIDVLHRCLGDKALFDVPKVVPPATALHNSQTQTTWAGLLSAAVRMQKRSVNFVAQHAARSLPGSVEGGVRGVITSLTDVKGRFRAALVGLADEKAQQSIMWLLRRLLDAVAQRKKTRTAMVSAHKGAQVVHEQPGHGLGAIGHQAPAKGDANACKLCPAPGGTKHSISFATGAETFTHTDFVLAAPLPIVWSRTYRSQFIAGDRNPLGARWLSAYGTRIDVRGRGAKRQLVYHGADGRSHRYPWLENEQNHRDPIEELTVTRLSASRLQLAFGKPMPAGESSPWCETYELVDAPAPGTEHECTQHYRLVTQQAPNGQSIQLRYDEHGLSALLSQQGDETLAEVRVECDPASGQVKRLWEVRAAGPEQLQPSERLLASYTHDAHGDLIQAQDENGACWQYRYRNHLVTRYTDRTGRGIQLRYDHHGEEGDPPTLPKAIREWSDDGSSDMRLEWDANIRLTYLTDALGGETWIYYDILGYTYRVIHPDQGEEWFFRDDAKNVTRHIHADGSTDDYRYDDTGNLIRHVRADGSAVHFEYDASHRVSGVLDPEGNVWKRDYNPQGQLSEATDPLGHKTAYAYDPAGRLSETTDAKGGKTKLAYTATGQLASYTDCSGRTTQWAYDERGRLQRRTDAAGNQTTYRYTAPTAAALQAAQQDPPANWPGQLATIVHADDSEEQWVHDAEGRLLSHTDALERCTRYGYDRAGRIAQRIDALGHTLAYRWDALGRLSELRNENGQPYRFAYDPVGRVLEEVGFDGQRTEYRYAEATGLLSEVIDGALVTRLSFDAMGRLSRRVACVAGGTEQTERFGYDARGQLGEARNADARLQYFYDDAGNLVREHHHYLAQNRTAVWQHRYNELNQRIGTTRPDGHALEWLTYGSGHVHGLLLDGEEVVGFERDALHREIHRTQANGIEQAQRYDPMGRLLAQQVVHRSHAHQGAAEMGRGVFQLGPGVQLGQAAAVLRRYGYDKAGQLERIEGNRRGRLAYVYDPVGRLLSALGGYGGERETFAFDPAGNILAVTPDELPEEGRRKPLPKVLDNLLKEYAGTSYVYDERGNLIERRYNGQLSTYAWDGFNRMTEAVTEQGRTCYAYDPLGRRIAKRTEVVKSLGSGEIELPLRQDVSETVYGWDGDTLAFESQGDDFRGHTVHYVHEAGSFVPLLQARRASRIQLAPTTDIAALRASNFGEYDIALDPLWNGDLDAEAVPFRKEEIAFYQCDHLGTPQEMTDHEGRVAWEVRYKAWGEAKVAISEAAKRAGLANPIRFQGQYLDDETGLHYNRHRYYDPVSGRFISKDPIGLIGGFNEHLYANNPVAWIDPLGLCPNGTATVHHTAGTEANPFGHYTVETADGSQVVHTHQGVFDNGGRTAILSNRGNVGSSQGTIALPNAKAAQAYQRKMMGQYLGPYDRKSNSCVSHVAETLRQGGLDVPHDAKGEFKMISNIARGKYGNDGV